ncbi:unnamed protein product [Prunus armeniaca]
MLDAAREYFVELQTWLLGSGGKHEKKKESAPVDPTLHMAHDREALDSLSTLHRYM